jgi:hypothetical protein
MHALIENLVRIAGAAGVLTEPFYPAKVIPQ